MEKENLVFEPEESLEDLFDLAAEKSIENDDEEEKADEPFNLLEDDDDEEEESNVKVASKKSTQSKQKADDYKTIIDTLAQDIDDFLVYEDHEEKEKYSKQEFSNLIIENINQKAEVLVQNTLTHILENMSPTAQKLLKGELNGVKIKDIIKDVEDYTDFDDIPNNPSDNEKEKIVRKYYNKIAKERGKSAEWVSSKLTKIVEMEDLDSEFEDAKEFFEEEIEKRIEEKRIEKEREEEEKIRFKQYHTYFTNEALKEDNIFGIKLTKNEKEEVANVLSSFIVHPIEKKEKMGLKLLIDNLVYSKNPKESYKTLALMTLVATRPNDIIKKLKSSAETEITREVHTKLKTANRPTTNRVTKDPITKTASIFDV